MTGVAIVVLLKFRLKMIRGLGRAGFGGFSPPFTCNFQNNFLMVNSILV
jgi:hypothetical protein